MDTALDKCHSFMFMDLIKNLQVTTIMPYFEITSTVCNNLFV